MNVVRGLLTALLTSALVACAPSSPGTATTSQADVDAVNNVRNEFVSAFNMGDAAKVASLYATDAVIMPTHQPMITGRDAIESYNKTFFEMFTATINVAPVETKVFGDRALDRGTYTIQITPKAGGSPMMDEGKYIVLLQRQADGSWKLTHDIDNTSMPLQAAATQTPPPQPGR
jgi:uncharacterized protein (TIGR02246 family)